MAYDVSGLVDEVQAVTGRTASGEPLVDSTRIIRWFNEGQVKVVQKCVNLHSLSFKNTTSLDTTQSLKYAISDITVGDNSDAERVNRIWGVSYLDGNNSEELDFMFTDDFDADYPDPTHSDIAVDKPTHWTRRGNNIEIFPLCACAYCDKDLRFEGDFFPHELSNTDNTYSDISGGDEGLIMYAVWKAWGAIGGQKATLEEIKWKKKWEDWLDDFQGLNDELHEWDGKLHNEILI